MPSIICIGPARAGAESNLIEQRFDRNIEGFLIQRFTDQGFLCFRTAPGSGSTGPHRNAYLVERVIQAFKPNRKVDDRQCHSLWTHDPFETGGLSFFGKWQMETNQQLLAML